ncbi:PREDICTED: LOW QUALITY PROTEIN: gastrin-releasing peptide [Myotis davidii]|uniref:LOW QUALITY PROTEIN: gastrin-releasing peptide n=1 Tax=Myotis davidii TaxID=225400 RepID=UPI0007677363|nr:PREDICTED: LOW QUALITY PROTEIN: gastrin-releasing peptide [Myotis davidii]
MRCRELPLVLLALVLCRAPAPEPARSSPSTQRHAKILSLHTYPTPPFPAPSLLNTFRKPGPRERLGPLVQPGVSPGCASCASQSLRHGFGGSLILAPGLPATCNWEAGHLMGKKSTGESPYVYKGESPKYQLQQHILWEEAVRTLLGLMEGKGTGSHQSPPQAPLGILQSTPDSDSEDSSNFSDVGSRLKGSQCEGRNPQLNRQ